ncbi:TPA: hypothetical protein N0F65_004363 [Lagenidium giganteum]|uniref:Peptidyl-prolyl cis-trans isomerase n=1 Tax=Lagenidium giganteum TaxID=4803 RepID=A0AAV2ZF17_9STRA|nr:TPA: hypothetical protein N0F65_004363 [Lagenidium giganteum]
MAKRNVWMLLAMLLATLLSVSMLTAVDAAAPVARASHILVDSESEIDELLQEVEAADNLAAKFAELAESRSKCPSGRRGGDLGEFGRGQMVPEFDKVVFEKDVGVVHKVKTQFGWHLVLTTERSGIDVDALDKDDL